MDKYVIDIDKVLDELELNDNYDTSIKTNTNNNNYHSNDSTNLSMHLMINNDQIDLGDADFSIHTKPPKLLLTSSSSESSSKILIEQNSNIKTIDDDIELNQNSTTITANWQNMHTNNNNNNNKSEIDNKLTVIEKNKDDDDSKIIHSQTIPDNNTDDTTMNQSEKETLLVINNDTQNSNQCLINDNKPACDNNSMNDINLTNEMKKSSSSIFQESQELNKIHQEEENEKIVKISEEIQKDDDNKPNNNLDEITIGAMSEEDLDKHLNDLNDDLQENIETNNDNQIKNESTNNIKEKETHKVSTDTMIDNDNKDDDNTTEKSPTINTVEQSVDQNLVTTTDADADEMTNEYWSKKLGLGETTDANDDDDEQAKQLQELEEILANSNDQQHQQQRSQENSQHPTTTTTTVTENDTNIRNSDRMNETRGGLVQNINYFERQEMPNGLTEEEQMLGKVKPFWIPDEDAQNCLHCDARFTIIKRRHHCRSCGKVLCSQCCNFKARLPYLDNKETRVCQLCYVILMKIEEIERISGRQLEIPNQNDSAVNDNASSDHPPDPNNPSEYCSTISPLEQVSEAVNLPPPTVMVPVGVLKRHGSSGHNRRSNNSPESSNSESITTVKQVMFSDGVRPGGDLVEQPVASSSNNNTMDGLQKPAVITRTQLQLKSPLAEKILVPFENFSKRIKFSRVVVSDPSNGKSLPPIINYSELKTANPSLPSKPNYGQLIDILRDAQAPWITFGLTKNLHINAKIISKTCCNNQECWSFSSKGLASVGQDEVICLIDCQSLRRSLNDGQIDNDNKSNNDDNNNKLENKYEFPRDVLRMYTALYDSASTANLYMDLMHIFFADGLFNNKENSGFIFTRPTMQCLRNIHLPPPPFLIAILIHRWEIPWAKIFPLRLVLRLGYEYKMYPSPVISYANRKSSYFEIGHTIMNVLADFRNYHYTLSVVKDLFICVEQKKRVTMFVPKLSYEKVCKVLSTSNEHVLAFGGNLCLRADSHFICIQNERDDDIHSQYRTELSSYQGSLEKLIGASFIVFSGVLKSTTGLKAKMNIVEDGLLVQIPPSLMEEFRSALKDMKDFRIDCCKVNDTNNEPDEWIQLKWVNDELSTNIGVRSQIDGMNLEGIQSARIFSNPDYANDRYLIRWIEVFLLKINDNGRRSEMINANKLAESISQAFCVALIDYLDQLYENGLTKISLRISLDIDKVGYETGSGGKPLPSQITQPLDNALIPVIMKNISTTGIEDSLIIELLFFVLLK